MPATPRPPSPSQALRFWFKLGCIGFGGPAGQIALMHRELVDEKRWIGERRFQHALSYCMLLPGPEAQQLATYLGWLMHGRAMGIAAGLLFILPAWILMVLLGWLYLAQGHQPALQAVLAGLKPAVVAIVAHAAWRLGRRQLDHPLWVAVALAACAGLMAGLPFPLLLLAAAALGLLARRVWPAALAPPLLPRTDRAPSPGAWLDDDSPLPEAARAGRPAAVLGVSLLLWALPMGLLLAWQGLQGFFPQLGLFFTQAALVTFGGAYAVLPYVAQAVVQQQAWISAGQLMDGLALGETTPGPLIIVLVFIGFVAGWQQGGGDPLAMGLLAALLVGWFTFLPSFAFILLGAPYVERSRHLPALAAPLRAVSSAVVGVIVQLGLFLAAHSLWPGGQLDAFACLLALACGLALIVAQRSVLEVIGLAALAGLLRGFWG